MFVCDSSRGMSCFLTMMFVEILYGELRKPERDDTPT